MPEIFNKPFIDYIGKIVDVDINREMKKSFLDYSMSVIVSRALPDVRDGLKPVHRRILYVLHENGLTPDKAYRKCADTVGSVLGRYHPHGDASVYDAMVRLAQTFSMRYPLIDGHGNFGSIDGDPAAAYRYTESRMHKLTLDMLGDIDKETVDWAPNYDDRLLEPVVLPSRIPTLLVNGSTGIAVGMATNIPPHNMGEVCDAVSYLIDNPTAELPELLDIIHGPDFPTAGIIMGTSGIRSAYATGRGKIVVRARCEIEEKGGGEQIIVTELPYQVNKARLLENIDELRKDKRIEGLSVPHDESSREGIRMVIPVTRGTNPNVVLNQLYKHTELQTSFGVIMLALVDGVPKLLTLHDVLTNFINFQADIVTRRTRFLLKKAQERKHILDGLKIALDYIDEVIKIIRGSDSQAEAKNALTERFGLDDLQTSAIVAMRLGQLTGLERQKLEDEIAALLEKINYYNSLLADHQLILGVVKDEIGEIRRKYGDERRTEITAVAGEVEDEDLIPEEDCVVTATHFGYLKRQAVDEYKQQHRGGRGVSGMKQREEDFAERIISCSSHDFLLFITSFGRMYRIKAFEIPTSGRNSKGTNIANVMELADGEKVTSIIRAPRDEDLWGRGQEIDGQTADPLNIVFVTRNGVIKKTSLAAYKNIRTRGLNAINLDDGDTLAAALLTEAEQENNLIIATSKGQAIRIDLNETRSIGRTARGVRGIKLREGDFVVDAERICDGDSVFTLTEEGKGRRTKAEEYHLQGRGGFGNKNYNLSKGSVIGVKVVSDDDDLILISSSGVVIRIPVSQTREMGRTAAGVRVMRLAESELVVGFESVPASEEEEEIAETEE